MRFAAIAPWIVDSWLEALRALSFDLPTVTVDDYQARVAVAVSALALLVFAWHSVGLLPRRQRLVSLALLMGVLLAPVADFAASHADAMTRWRMALAHSDPTTPGDQTQAEPVTNAALPSSIEKPHTAPAANAPIEPPADPTAAAGPISLEPASPETEAGSKRTRFPAAQAGRRPTADSVPLYYGTNRTAVRGVDSVQFTATPSTQLSLGRADIARPQRMARDRVWPVAHTSDLDIGLRSAARPSLTALSHDAFHEASVLQLAISERDKGHVLVVIPGFTMGFEAAIQRAALLATELDFDGATFVFSWPSSGSPTHYTSDRAAAIDARPHLAAFLKLVALESGATSVNLVVHGLGSELVLAAIDDITTALPTAAPPRMTVQNLILVAPDMGRASFVERWGKVAGHIERTTLYAADTDRALNVSRRYAGAAPRAGDLLAGAPLLLPGLLTVDATAIGTDAVGAANAGPGDGQALTGDIGTRLRRTGPVELLAATERITTTSGSYLRYRAAGAP